MQAQNSRPAILCFAGLDPSGGAGLQADIEAIAACGGHALPIATCLTVQNSMHATSVTAIDPVLVHQQAQALLADLPIAGCKIGVIPNVQLAEVIRVCRNHRTLSAAGRELFQASRLTRQSINDADRLRKYLAKFGLSWSAITDR